MTKVISREYANDLYTRLITRATIRRNIKTRKSVQEGKPDKISDLLEEAALLIKDGCIVKISKAEYDNDKYA